MISPHAQHEAFVQAIDHLKDDRAEGDRQDRNPIEVTVTRLGLERRVLATVAMAALVNDAECAGAYFDGLLLGLQAGLLLHDAELEISRDA